MTREKFNEGFAALLAAFPNSDKSTESTQKIYWEMLQEIPDDYWQEGVAQCLKTLTFFPTIHDVGVACFGETKEHDEHRCDPYRFKQNYVEHVDAIPWQENMRKVLEDEQLKIDGPPQKKRLLVPERAKFKFILDDDNPLIDRLQTEIVQLKQEIGRLQTIPKPSIDERKKILKEQADFLMKSN